MLKVGDKVPAFSVLNEKSETITDQSFFTQKIILQAVLQLLVRYEIIMIILEKMDMRFLV
jgi:hypothetical protein